MVAALDPLGLPLVSEVVAGNTADDPLYVPAMARVLPIIMAGACCSSAIAR